MTKLSTYNGIILRRVNYGEKDCLFTIFTRELGKVTAFASSVRISQKRYSGKLDIFTQAEYALRKRKSGNDAIWTLASAESWISYLYLRTQLSNMAFATYLSECILEFCPQEFAQPMLYDWFLMCLENLNTGEEIKAPQALRMELDLLRLCGYSPSWNRCQDCGQRFMNERSYFSYESGGVICSSCSRAGHGIWFIRDTNGKSKPETIGQILGNFTEHVLGKSLKSRSWKDELIYGNTASNT